jgi:pimeloyl-ACP methyl ester carboxylesterase
MEHPMSRRLSVLSLLLILVLAPLSGATAADKPMTRERATGILREVRKITSSNGIDEARAVEIGGIRQWITVRGRDRRNPILLVIHGGPASVELANRYLFEDPWTDYFTVVEWDQRGAGKTYGLNDPGVVGPTITKARMIEDAEEVTAWLRRTYGRDKIFVMGHSWGTVLGMSLAQRRPEWLYAYIGVGQIINMKEGEKIGYAFALDAAKAARNAQAVKELEAIAPYPAADGAITLDMIGTQRKWNLYYGGLTHGRDNYAYWDRAQALSPDYSDTDVANIDKGSALTLPRLLPELAQVNFDGVTRLDCPVVIFAGRHDYTTPSTLAAKWLERVKAPSKRLVWFENSAHMLWAEENGRVLVHLVQDVLPYAKVQP